MKKAGFLAGLLWVLLTLLGGCRIIRIEEEERTPVEYEVVKQEDIPKELAVLIGEKKQKEFQMTYQSGNVLYLVKGYGLQMSGGYSIQVEELGKSPNAVFFRTKLLGPSELKGSGGAPSYPYIVIKTAYFEEPVQFEGR